MRVLENTEPKEVFYYFEEIAGIPHGSRDTKRISDYLKGFAMEQGLKYIQDEADNVIIFKDGSRGYENSGPVILQAHMDMVCEKEADCDIDFTNEGLRLKLEDGIISAEKTTLGGDDGIGVAYILALLASKDIPHPPIEAVITADEEIGMLGASALDLSPLKGKRMINIDSEEEGIFTLGCAGGIRTDCHLPLLKSDINGTEYEISLEGFMGGHSGMSIDKGRANPNHLMGRLLYALKEDIRLLSVNGGLKDNAIPRSSKAVLVVPENETDTGIFKKIEMLFSKIKDEYRTTDPSIECRVKECGRYSGAAFDKRST
ncbi:MAG: M20/M25/M40 family metallo-hydrolase, partial [Lachnospiraceae bacterium]|nr:M20/M25/M40 family metallo-hydrolase [Lachnospiraceae bacterium]